MTKRVCVHPGCPTLVDGGRCVTHRRQHDRARGTRQQRGYDAAYDRERQAYQARMDRGESFLCWRCAELGSPHLIDPTDWHLGHDNDDRAVIRGPQCPASNLNTSRRHAPAPGGPEARSTAAQAPSTRGGG